MRACAVLWDMWTVQNVAMLRNERSDISDVHMKHKNCCIRVGDVYTCVFDRWLWANLFGDLYESALQLHQVSKLSGSSVAEGDVSELGVFAFSCSGSDKLLQISHVLCVYCASAHVWPSHAAESAALQVSECTSVCVHSVLCGRRHVHVCFRSLCRHSKERCESVLGIVGLQWPEDTDCAQFPEEGQANSSCLMPDLDVSG